MSEIPEPLANALIVLAIFALTMFAIIMLVNQ